MKNKIIKLDRWKDGKKRTVIIPPKAILKTTEDNNMMIIKGSDKEFPFEYWRDDGLDDHFKTFEEAEQTFDNDLEWISIIDPMEEKLSKFKFDFSTEAFELINNNNLYLNESDIPDLKKAMDIIKEAFVKVIRSKRHKYFSS